MSHNITYYTDLIEKTLSDYLPKGNYSEQLLIDSMGYSLICSGKRIRPLLTLLFCELCNTDINAALPFACAVEMIHTYSLIHDDLPCMDDDDFRRGKPSNHIVYGEDIATLAGDALQSYAFEIMLSDSAVSATTPIKAAKAAHTLAKYSGVLGMVGGQVIDIQNEDKHADIDTLREMDLKKTACLIMASCEIGCIIGGASDEQLKSAREYAESIGIAFQIMDDILDVTSDTVSLGKPAGSDLDNNKSTYVSLLGIDECNRIVSQLTDRAIASLDSFDADTSALKQLAIDLKNRKK